MIFLSYLFTVIAIIGGIFNARGSIYGFYLWLLSNGYFVLDGLIYKRYYQVILFGVYSITTIYGIKKWKGRK